MLVVKKKHVVGPGPFTRSHCVKLHGLRATPGYYSQGAMHRGSPLREPIRCVPPKPFMRPMFTKSQPSSLNNKQTQQVAHPATQPAEIQLQALRDSRHTSFDPNEGPILRDIVKETNDKENILLIYPFYPYILHKDCLNDNT